MKLNGLVESLNEHGCLGSLVVCRKMKISREEALKILKRIVRQYENVYFIQETLIVIMGCEKDWMIPGKIKTKRITKKWKNITKP